MTELPVFDPEHRRVKLPFFKQSDSDSDLIFVGSFRYSNIVNRFFRVRINLSDAYLVNEAVVKG